MTKRLHVGIVAIGLGALCSWATAAPIISDDFEVDSSANYTVVNSAPDGSATFAFDYVGAGIPLAPNSSVGDKGGLRMTANDTAGATNAYTAFHNTQITGMSNYTLQVDVYLNVTAGATGTTEHAHVGVAGDGATFNQLFSRISGTGHYLAFDGDGGTTSDFRHFKAPNPVNTGDPSYLDPAHTTNNTGALYQSLFPSGMPGNLWTTLTIDIVGGVGGTITYSFDGTPIIQDTVVAADGYISLGYADLFTSVANPFQSQFVVYDNLVVTPEPVSLSLLALGSVGLLRRRRSAA